MANSQTGSEIAVAVITTVGTLFGVLVGSLIAWTLEVQRARRAEQVLERAALRVLHDDLRSAAWQFENMGKELRVVRDFVESPVSSWEDYREFFAGKWSTDNWNALARAIVETRKSAVSLRSVLPHESPTGELNASLSKRALETAVQLREAADKAAELGGFAST